MANNPFAVEQKVYNLMPNDEYIDACILSYQTAELPPGPMAMTNDTVPSTRFLLGAYLKDESGQLKCDANGVPIIARKWTKWMRISNTERSALMRLFDTSLAGVANIRISFVSSLAPIRHWSSRCSIATSIFRTRLSRPTEN